MIIDCLSKVILLFAIYCIVSIMLFGIPRSLSATHYLFKEREDILKYLFPSTTIAAAILLASAWIGCSPTPELTLLSVLAGLALVGVGVTYIFTTEYITESVHLATACLFITLMLLWIIFVTPYWYMIIVIFVIALAAALMTKTLKTAYIFWIEIMALVANVICVLMYYFNFVK